MMMMMVDDRFVGHTTDGIVGKRATKRFHIFLALFALDKTASFASWPAGIGTPVRAYPSGRNERTKQK